MVETISEEAFEKEALDFLQSNAEPRVEITRQWGEGSDKVSLFPERTPEEDRADLEAAQSWSSGRFDAGFGWITGPEEYGGRNLPRSYQRIYDHLESGFNIPSQAVFGIGLGMIAPTILAHATEEVKEKYLRNLYRGDIVACQLFSEPSAGSDLASLQTKAVRD
jgi:acyl-CoA dehydrogenase